MTNIEEVKNFWNDNPLFAGESDYEIGTKEFFEDHKHIYYSDCFAGKFNDKNLIPEDLHNSVVLDLGCGTGFWTIEILQRRNCKELHSADLSERSLEVTKKRLDLYNLNAHLSVQNAEKLTYADGNFDHINCQGVIHHTPDTDKAIKEIARVLKSGGTAYISVYYRNIFLRYWKYFSFIGKVITKLGGGLQGRGRDSIFNEKDPDEITRLYDGENNPIGKSYTKKQIITMVSPYFEVMKTFLFFFPARALPFKIPKFIHQFLAKNFGFMIFLQLKKK